MNQTVLGGKNIWENTETVDLSFLYFENEYV